MPTDAQLLQAEREGLLAPHEQSQLNELRDIGGIAPALGLPGRQAQDAKVLAPPANPSTSTTVTTTSPPGIVQSFGRTMGRGGDVTRQALDEVLGGNVNFGNVMRLVGPLLSPAMTLGGVVAETRARAQGADEAGAESANRLGNLAVGGAQVAPALVRGGARVIGSLRGSIPEVKQAAVAAARPEAGAAALDATQAIGGRLAGEQAAATIPGTASGLLDAAGQAIPAAPAAVKRLGTAKQIMDQFGAQVSSVLKDAGPVGTTQALAANPDAVNMLLKYATADEAKAIQAAAQLGTDVKIPAALTDHLRHLVVGGLLGGVLGHGSIGAGVGAAAYDVAASLGRMALASPRTGAMLDMLLKLPDAQAWRAFPIFANELLNAPATDASSTASAPSTPPAR